MNPDPASVSQRPTRDICICSAFSDWQRGCTCVLNDWTCTDSDEYLVRTKCISLFQNSEERYCVSCSSGTGIIPEPILHNGSSPLCTTDKQKYSSPRGDYFDDYLQYCTDDIATTSCSWPMEYMQLNNNANVDNCESNQCLCIGVEEQ